MIKSYMKGHDVRHIDLDIAQGDFKEVAGWGLTEQERRCQRKASDTRAGPMESQQRYDSYDCTQPPI